MTRLTNVLPHARTPTRTGPHYESLWTVDGKVVNPKIGHDFGLVAMNSVVALGTHPIVCMMYVPVPASQSVSLADKTPCPPAAH